MHRGRRPDRPRSVARHARARAYTHATMTWTIYLSGEVHTPWREEIEALAAARDLPVRFTSAVTDHPASDAAGDHLPPASEGYWRDHKSAGVNAIRTTTLLRRCDLAVVRFGDEYKQWNAAFDAGYAAALGKPIITLHPPEHDHALKEVDAAAKGVAREPFQVVQALAYAINGGMPAQWYQKEAAE